MLESNSQLEPERRTENNMPRRMRARWFPVAILIVAGAIIAIVISSGRPRRFKFIASVGTALVGVGSCILWTAICVCKRRWTRSATLIAPFAVVALLVGTIRPVFDGDMALISWEFRWASRADELLDSSSIVGEARLLEPTQFDFPGFLGPNGDGTVDSVELETDWVKHPIREMWRVEVGAGWSGFAVVGNYAVTQEQRGEYEMVVCRRLDDGKIVWSHRDAVRFDPAGYEKGSVGEIGPRATPVVYDSKVFSHGATGLLNCIDARSGKVLWTHDTISENQSQVLTWGKSGSPIIVDNNVVVSVGGPEGKSLIAYDCDTGDIAWSGGDRQSSYATPVLATIAGVRQIVCVNEDFVTAHRADDGAVLWEHAWPGKSSANASCPNAIPVGDDRILLCKGYGVSSELLVVSQGADGRFSTKRLWKKPVMRLKITNAIVHDGFVYGLDGGILECIELATGKKMWKRGRYGHGQVLLVDDVLLITTELKGDVVLVEASPEGHRVLATEKVLETRGKMWNYPAVAGKYLLVRNAEEAACFEMPLRSGS